MREVPFVGTEDTGISLTLLGEAGPWNSRGLCTELALSGPASLCSW